jgi:hypothetical protein
MLKLSDALQIAEFFLPHFEPLCEPDCCKVAGSVRRKKPYVHDIEFVLKPILKAPRAVFGQKVTNNKLMKTLLDQKLFELVQDGYLSFYSGADRNRKYSIDLARFDLEPVEGFLLDLWITIPPAQFGVNYVIRTGPGSPQDHFSKWIVTPQSSGGALPDGYRVKHAAVWRIDQLDVKDKPFEGESPREMPTEDDFLSFLGLLDVAPADRHADWGRYTR